MVRKAIEKEKVTAKWNRKIIDEAPDQALALGMQNYATPATWPV
jgi:hypothetical protein